MKTKKIKFISEQILFILLFNYLIVIDSGFIYKTHWLPTFVFALLFFHAGTFATLYATITSKAFSKEKEQLLFNFNLFIYLSFIGLLLYYNCQVATNNLVINYCLGLYMLVNAIIFLFETYSSYKKYSATLIANL